MTNPAPQPTPNPVPGIDPVRARRVRIARVNQAAQRIGYLLYLVAVVVFAIGAAGRFTPAIVAVVVTSLAVGSVLLVPTIIIGYGVRAAERDDRRAGR
ncbi:MAG: hypothetical protein QOI99_1566 [Actinomycetota bacterium]|nr:hypothetical protein [Actinomycetota bacterium]